MSLPDRPPIQQDAPVLKTDSPVANHLRPSPNHGERRGGADGLLRQPDMIILHYTGMVDAASALLQLCNPIAEVSSHYLVFDDGRIWQLVPESRRAWHAGRSSWHGETDLNSASIGIEIVNRGHDLSVSPPVPHAYPAFPDEQIEAVIRLVADIKARWLIPDDRILAHSDVASGRKIDPGENFPWARLAAAGLGLWPWASEAGSPHLVPPLLPSYRPGDEGMPIAALQSLFARFGYGIEISGVFDQRTLDVVTAFQRHWRPERVDGVADGETLARLDQLLRIAAQPDPAP